MEKLACIWLLIGSGGELRSLLIRAGSWNGPGTTRANPMLSFPRRPATRRSPQPSERAPRVSNPWIRGNSDGPLGQLPGVRPDSGETHGDYGTADRPVVSPARWPSSNPETSCLANRDEDRVRACLARPLKAGFFLARPRAESLINQAALVVWAATERRRWCVRCSLRSPDVCL